MMELEGQPGLAVALLRAVSLECFDGVETSWIERSARQAETMVLLMLQPNGLSISGLSSPPSRTAFDANLSAMSLSRQHYGSGRLQLLWLAWIRV